MGIQGMKYLILGVSNAGLFIARQLRKQWPNCMIYAVGDIQDIGRYSNVIDRFYGAHASEEIIDSITHAYTDMGKGEVNAYMCSNPMLELVVLKHPEIFDYLKFDNPVEVYQKLVDKVQTEQLCRSLKITRPEEYCLTDISNGAIAFPVVVKPLEKRLAIGASKCAYLADQDHLESYLVKMDSLGIDRNCLVCQQLVEGDNRWEYGYGGYFINGEAIVDICFHQFKQVPQGLCCYSREMTDAELADKIKMLVKPLLIDLKYNGFIEFDIKQDVNTKELYLLDVNPRSWRSVDMLTVKLNGSTVFSPVVCEKKAVWRYRYRELFSRKNKRNVSYKDCKTITGTTNFVCHNTLYDKNDREPMRQQNKQDLKDLIKKIVK